MITSQDLYDLYTHYVSESNKWKTELDNTHGMKAGTKYNIEQFFKISILLEKIT